MTSPDRELELRAFAATESFSKTDDAADDPAIWVDRDRPERSLVLGTNKKGGLHVYDLSATPLAVYGMGLRPNNVDVLHRARLGGRELDLVMAETRADGMRGLMFWSIESATRRLVPLLEAPLPVARIAEPYGSCFGLAMAEGPELFVGSKSGLVLQLRLCAVRSGYELRQLRMLPFLSQVEGMCVDRHESRLYVGEEEKAVWCLPARPILTAERTKVLSAGRDFVPDVEGLTLLRGERGRAWLLASLQGEDRFAAVPAAAPHAPLVPFRILGPEGERVRDTDGIAAHGAALGGKLPRGLLVAQDGARQRFVFVDAGPLRAALDAAN